MSLSERPAIFASLHRGPKLLILPNAWDGASARLFEHAGAKAIATSSASLAWAHGYADGEHMPFETLLASVREIAATVGVPVSADIESAYASDADGAAETVQRVMAAGAVGINIEDGVMPSALLAGKIAHLRRASADLWINARIDTYLRKLVPLDRVSDETVTRAHRYRDAGASSIFVPGLSELAVIEKLVKAVDLPLNLLAWPGLPDAKALEQVGVRRLSAGSSIGLAAFNHAFVLAQRFLSDGNSAALAGGPLDNAAVNAMLRR